MFEFEQPISRFEGNCWDNAVAESFFATSKQELIYRRTWTTRAPWLIRLLLGGYGTLAAVLLRLRAALGRRDARGLRAEPEDRTLGAPEACNQPIFVGALRWIS